MQHTIPVQQLGAEGEVMAHAIEKCVHCGFCLAVCPTYAVLGEEMDSPRGRIMLMKSALEGTLTVEETLPHIDRCLGCVACVPACPSGVPYGELLPLYRAYAAPHRPQSLIDRAAKTLVHETLPYPDRFRLAALTGKVGKLVQGVLPTQFQGMLNLLPDELPNAQPLPEIYPAEGQRRARVALLAGCVQQVLAPNINWATLRVLAKNGVEVIIPRGQGCCGSLGLHTGELERARNLACSNFRAFPKDVDAVITNAAGCGSGMKEYGVLFAGQPEQAEAQTFASRVKDVSEFLTALGLTPPPALPQPLKVAYHDACHLAHAQTLTAPPRQLLASIPNLTLAEIPEGEMCCGSAGTYNLEQPALAAQFGARKAQNILNTGVQAVATGNIGCLIQIRTHLQKKSDPLPIYHTLELLDLAYANS
ncbi:MAG: 4Fe-4S dicluster domain-containing protein [Anaerolineales bacterium]|nr:4Fe-4S dicluster domain-containing protein [Anaerolineales bacterium]